MFTMRERIECVTGFESSLVLTVPHLQASADEIIQRRDRRVGIDIEGDGLTWSVPALFLSSRLALREDEGSLMRDVSPGTVFYSRGQIVGYCLPPSKKRCRIEDLMNPDLAVIGSLAGEGTVIMEVESRTLDSVWDLIRENERLLCEDFALFTEDEDRAEEFHKSVVRSGNEEIMIARGAEIRPCVFLDTGKGPIRIEDGAEIHPFVHLEGPAYVGRGSILLSGAVVKGGTTIGPMCRIGGDVECCVFQGFSNKAHEGFLGHSYVGEWVNLGAGTTNSDLKNNYRPVRITMGDQVHDTGMVKMGALIGDHVKTGIGTLITTGGVLGTGVNVFGGGVQPKYIPPFVWGGSGRYDAYRLEPFLETAAAVSERRNRTLTDTDLGLLETVYRMSAGERSAWLSGRGEG